MTDLTHRPVYSDLPADRRNPAAFIVRNRPEVSWSDLPLAPRLESWMSKDHPDSVRLREFIDDAVPRLAHHVEGERCGLELTVRLPDGLLIDQGGRDLDNYLFPLVNKLGAARLVSVFGTKETGALSRARAGVVRDEAPPMTGWSFASSEAIGPAGSILWRDSVKANLSLSESAPSGPLEVQVTFRGSRGNWHYDWKATIDALGAILGLEPNGRHANDSRITRLALHRMHDSRLAPRTLIGIWWRAA